MQPLVFEPYLRPMVWGGRKLGDLLGKHLPSAEPYGESWELSPHPHHVSRVAEGPHKGAALTEVCRDFSQQIFGELASSESQFPLLIKFLDCRELLSIQVHPNDALAGPLAGETYGKTEAWMILHVEPQGKIYSGFQPGVTRAEVERRLADGTLEAVLHGYTPHVGDCLFLPAGTVHAVGGGVLMAEVQQASDATFRLHDWNRMGSDGKPRTLHLREALEAIDWLAGPVNPIPPSPLKGSPTGAREERLVKCPQFGMDRVTFQGRFPIANTKRPTVWIVLSGTATLQDTTDYQRSFTLGETVLIPAQASSVAWQTAPGTVPATLLRVTLPERS